MKQQDQFLKNVLPMLLDVLVQSYHVERESLNACYGADWLNECDEWETDLVVLLNAKQNSSRSIPQLRESWRRVSNAGERLKRVAMTDEGTHRYVSSLLLMDFLLEKLLTEIEPNDV